MPFRIRCPHCHRVLIADTDTAGQEKLCPACSQRFHVPLPHQTIARTPDRPASEPPIICPRCGTEAAPTAAFCHKCHTDLKTGRRLPLKRRLRLFSWRFWTVGTFSVVVVALLVFVGVRLYLIRSQTAASTYRPLRPEAVPADEFASQLLAAKDAEERRSALAAMSGVELRVAPAVARALADSLGQGAAGAEVQRSRMAAMDLLVRQAEEHADQVPQWLRLFERCQEQKALYAAALRGRALLGDAGALDPLSDLWLARLQRFLTLSRVVAVSRTETSPGAKLILRRARADLERCEDGLRALTENEANPVFQRLAEVYWTSWQWLGQETGDKFARRLFSLARPAGQSLEFRPEDDVRRSRDRLRRVAEQGTPAARAAAGMILETCVPQYKRRSREIAGALAELLPECEALDQQRITWTVGRLRGMLFSTTSRRTPLDVTAAEIEAAQRWVFPDRRPALKPPYAMPPALSYRAVTAEHLLERDLLGGLRSGWSAAEVAMDQWITAGLGCSVGLREMLNPGSRQPDYPALAAAMVIAAANSEQSVRPQLELWVEAVDQPAWVRALAYTVLGSFDARQGEWTSGWPGGLDLGDAGVLDAGHPGWSHFGRILVAGGERMTRRLNTFGPAPAPPGARARLLDAARQVVEDSGQGG